MLVTVPQANVQRAGINSISVGQIGIGPIRIGQLVLSNLDFTMSAGVAHLSNFRVTVSLRITLDWRIHISLPDGLDINEGDTINLGQPSFTLGLGNVTLPGLQNFALRIDSLTAANFAASVNPLTNLQLGSAVAEQIRARNIVLPSQGFQVAGLTINAARADGIGIPAANVEEVTVGRVHGDAGGMGDIRINGFGLPGASVQDLVSQSIDVSATAAGTAFRMDAGILVLTLTVTPSARAQIDQLEISNINASTTVGGIVMQNVVAPYELLNLTLGQIGIETIDIPNVAIG